MNEVYRFIKSGFSDRLKINVRNITDVGGGSINFTFRVDADDQTYFVKVNTSSEFPGMFTLEKNGLDLLRKSNVISVPQVLFIYENEKYQMLVLEWIESGRKSKNFFVDFGKSLALMHQVRNNNFGLDHDNYIGSLKQINSFKADATEFFIQNRIQVQAELAIKNRLLNAVDISNLEQLYDKLKNIIPDEPPSLLHGDLWSGNFICDRKSDAWLIDPAVYYGPREAEIAMTNFFGGFDPDFYSSYNEVYPLPPGWQERLPLWNLYPLLVHLNLFGSGYLIQVRNVLKKFL